MDKQQFQQPGAVARLPGRRRARTLAMVLPMALATMFAGRAFAAGAPDDGPGQPLAPGLIDDDPFYYTADQRVKADDGQKALVGVGRPNRTHSQVPHLPAFAGYMNTNYTYRFISVTEQVMTMIGEGKHGLWRVAENGTVREYRRKGAAGLPADADPTAAASLATLASDYEAWLPDEGFDGYRYPDQRVAADGRLNYVDLPITHPKYHGKYDEHPVIDLPSFYCTMSEADYPYARKAMEFAFAQPGANRIGPLGRRAGLDVNENYTRVIRMQQFPDARSWVNVGVPGKDESWLRWAAIDTRRTPAEYYLVERPFFNVPYLFVMAVFDNADNADLRYVRPEGAYYDAVRTRVAKAGTKGAAAIPTKVTMAPRFHLEGGSMGRAVGLPIFGVHHPDRAAFGGGGACPLKGGDWGRYPKTDGGAGWPTQYEEVTPLCDAVLVDIKFYSNLDGRDWNDPDKYLANAGVGKPEVEYRMQPGHYGSFTDPYNQAHRQRNAQERDVPARLTLHYPSTQPAVSWTEPPPPRRAMPMMPSASTSCRPVRAATP